VKYFYIFLITVLNSVISNAQMAEFSFDKTVINYGVINEGDTLHGYFMYTNTGKEPLTITSYVVECHCTEVSFPSTPTLPMASDTIHFTFHSEGKSYAQDRKILLNANVKKELATVRFKVYVNPKS
jgi:hypothetical protein